MIASSIHSSYPFSHLLLCQEESKALFSSQEIAKSLWLDPEAVISKDMTQKVNQVAIYLKEQGFELSGVKAGGNCFCHAFLESYDLCSRTIPILHHQENAISYLREMIANQFDKTRSESEKSCRSQQIKKDGEWLTSDEGGLLAKILDIPIRIVTVNQDQNGCGISDMVIFPKKDGTQQAWSTLHESNKPKDEEYIFIVDLGEHFIYAHPFSKKRKFSKPDIPSSINLTTFGSKPLQSQLVAQSDSGNPDGSFRPFFKRTKAEKDFQFEQIQHKVKLGLLKDEKEKEEAKDDLGNLLKDWEDQDLEKSIAGFQLMSEIFLQDEKYPEAAAILWYTKRLDKDQTSHLKIDAQLDVIERTLLQKATHQEGPLRGITQAMLDQEKLKQLRERIKEEYLPIQAIENHVERAQALRRLYQQSITKNLKIYIHELAQDVIKQMEAWGKSTPCEYALIGFGSLAREEMTPYSDFEFAILIDSEKEEYKEYFRIFTQLLHLRFINLGETILPSLDIRYLRWVFDTMTSRGLSFDGNMPKACKTPLGRKGYYELIHTPKGLSRLQFIDVEESNQKRLWILQRYHLPSILSACTYVTGSKEGMDLVSDYQDKVQKILQKEGKKRAADLMKNDLNNFKPHLEDEESGKHYHVKKDLYRLPNTMFDGLANYFCLKANSTWERIEELEEKGLFSSKGAQDLKELVMLSQELRLSTYLHHECQKDHLDIETQKINLKELYYRLIPFAASMELFCTEMTKEQGQPEVCLKKEQFYQNSLFHQGIIAFRHMDYLEAERCLNLEAIDTLQYYELLGAVKNTLGKYKEAEEAYRKAIEKQASCHLYIKLGEVRQSLGRYKNEESAEEAFFQAKDLAERSSDQISLERIYRHLTSLYKECADYNSMRTHLRLCKEQSQKRTSAKEKDAGYGVVLDLDLAKTKELEAEILRDLDSQFGESEKLSTEAYRIFQGYYRRDDHPALLNYIGVENLVDRQNLLNEQKKRLKIKIKIFGKEHPDVADSYNTVSVTLYDLGKHEKALKKQRKALEIRRKIFGDVHPDVATSYNNVGFTLVLLGKYEEVLEKRISKYEEALENQRTALEIQRKIFGEIHPDIAISYGNIGCTFGHLGKYEEALENHKKDLERQRKIFGEMHPSVAVSYNNVGATLLQKQDCFSAIHHFKKALDIYQSYPCYQLHSHIVTSLNSLTQCYNALNDKKKSSQHTQESKNISRELNNQKAFQKTEDRLMDCLHKKEYRTAYNLLTKLQKYLQEAPQFFCRYLQIALLCPNLNPHVREKRIQAIDNALKKKKGSIPTRLKLCVNLAFYWLNEKSPNWNKAYECIKHLSQLLEMAPTLCFKYEFLDVLAFGDNPLIEGECISAQILCNFIALKIYQGKKNSTIVPIAAKQLLERVNTCHAQGHKIEEIKNFCVACLNQQNE